MESNKFSQLFEQMMNDLNRIDDQLAIRLQSERQTLQSTAKRQLLVKQEKLEVKLSKLEQTLFLSNRHMME